ncbi:MAG: DUF420 domain-containing protein [Planctomycetes bacterium]|nr:DUF420 domain-containing protein [Planctomycetota bacterium]
MLTQIAIALATTAMILIVAGLIMARDRRRHVPLMLAAFALDMVGLVIVEFGPLLSGKTDPVSGLATEFAWAKTIHAVFATVAVVGYIMQIISGRKILAGDRTQLIAHKKWARIFLTMRLLAYVTMFTL